VLDVLEAEGLLEEARFIESFVRARIDKGQGPTRIRADLIQRGIDEAHIQVGLREACQDWDVLAAKVRRKRFGMNMPSDFTERARQMRFLQYRGFERGQIEAALDLAAESD
jgi:regulatory protein